MTDKLFKKSVNNLQFYDDFITCLDSKDLDKYIRITFDLACENNQNQLINHILHNLNDDQMTYNIINNLIKYNKKEILEKHAKRLNKHFIIRHLPKSTDTNIYKFLKMLGYHIKIERDELIKNHPNIFLLESKVTYDDLNYMIHNNVINQSEPDMTNLIESIDPIIIKKYFNPNHISTYFKIHKSPYLRIFMKYIEKPHITHFLMNDEFEIWRIYEYFKLFDKENEQTHISNFVTAMNRIIFVTGENYENNDYVTKQCFNNKMYYWKAFIMEGMYDDSFYSAEIEKSFGIDWNRTIKYYDNYRQYIGCVNLNINIDAFMYVLKVIYYYGQNLIKKYVADLRSKRCAMYNKYNMDKIVIETYDEYINILINLIEYISKGIIHDLYGEDIKFFRSSLALLKS